MKKTLLSIFAVAALSFSAAAGETTLVMADNWTATTNIEEWSQDGFNFTVSKGEGSTAPSYNGNGKDVRLYAKNTMVVSSSVAMTSITFDLSSQGKARLPEVAASTGSFGEFTVGPDYVVWTGNATEVTFTVDPNGNKAIYGTDGSSKAGQFDFLSMTIVTEGAETVSAPNFTPAPGTYYTPQTVTISSRTAGADVYFSMDGSEFELYDGSDIEVEESTTIKAYAQKGDLKSDEVVAEYIIAEMPSYTSLADVLADNKDLANKAYSDPFVVDFEPIVTYVNGSNTYVTEDGSFCLIYRYELGIEAGHKVAKGWQAQLQNFNGLFELVPLQGETVEAGEECEIPAPVYVQSASDINEDLISAVVLVANVSFAEATPDTRTTYIGTLGDEEVTFYNNYTLASVEAGSYDVLATVGSYNAPQIQPIEFRTANAISGVEADENAAVEYFNLQGIRVDNPAAGTIVIRRQGNEVSKMLVR